MKDKQVHEAHMTITKWRWLGLFVILFGVYLLDKILVSGLLVLTIGISFVIYSETEQIKHVYEYEKEFAIEELHKKHKILKNRVRLITMLVFVLMIMFLAMFGYKNNYILVSVGIAILLGVAVYHFTK